MALPFSESAFLDLPEGCDTTRFSPPRLTEGQRAELDRRWAEHVANPESAIPWSDVRAKLLG